ncbi:trypsin epsilon-like [Microplitis mediator]|uniref:trypsin epsilon-like n=1 Tax=Microplitis mediator TaxID=375433 RepID=UPI0025552B02|nr:trypsin epsilon-like [Microplitis mediator]
MEFKLASIFLLAITAGVLATDIKINEAPYQVSIQFHGIHYCSGAIISDYWVVTSAQCLKDIGLNSPYLTIRTGATSTQRDGSVHKIHTYKVHERFELNDGNIPFYDIGLIQVADYFTFDSTCQPIRLINPYDPTVHKSYNVTGWDIHYNDNDKNGTDVSAGLKKQKWRQVDHSKCREFYFFWDKFNDNLVCAVSEGQVENPCALGDLGDPLVIDGYLVGVKSWKMDCDVYPHLPTLFTNVRNFYEWIMTTNEPIPNLLQTDRDDYD